MESTPPSKDPFSDGPSSNYEHSVSRGRPSLGTGEESTVTTESWTGSHLTNSPKILDKELDLNLHKDARSSNAEPTKPRRFQKPSRSATPDLASSRLRWAQLRTHVLAVSSRPASPSQPPPKLAGSSLPRASSPQAQKPSRLARLGFRQVVEHARGAVSDDARKFGQEIYKICWSIRTRDAPRSTADRDGSSVQQPYRSNIPIFVATDAVTANNAHNTYERRPTPPEGVSIAQNTQTRAAPSIRPLYNYILQCAMPSDLANFATTILPHEPLVLSTLLAPFYNCSGGLVSDEECQLAIDSFEAIIRTWSPSEETLSVERYLWCCNAAATLPKSTMRTRILGMLFTLMISPDTSYPITSPDCFHSLLQGLFSLFPSLPSSPEFISDDQDTLLLHDVINKVRSGSCGELNIDSIRGGYNHDLLKEDVNHIWDLILLQALSQCLEVCPENDRLWLFDYVLERYWVHCEQFSPVLSEMYSKTLGTLSHALLNLLTISPGHVQSPQRLRRIAEMIQHRFIHEMDVFVPNAEAQPRVNIVNIVLSLIYTDHTEQLTGWATTLISNWYEESSPWKGSLEAALRGYILDSGWSFISSRLSSIIKVLPGESRHLFVAFVFPLLHEKLVEVPPTHPCEPLTSLLDLLSRADPQIFFKPLFSCAASSKEYTVINHLCVIAIIAKFLPDFWIRDAEMISVALMSDVGTRKGKTSEGGNRSWAQARLGQTVLMIEVIDFIQRVRHNRETSAGTESLLVIETTKFVLALESRLGILMEAKERNSAFPPSHRLIFCVLLREMRLLTRSLKPASWLSLVISWFVNLANGKESSQDPEEEERSTVSQIRALYSAALDSIRSAHRRRTTIMLSKTLEKSLSGDAFNSSPTELTGLLIRKETLLTSLLKGFSSKALKLLVTMSTLLETEDYRQLIPHLWEQLSMYEDVSLVSSLCFLIMKSAERTPADLLPTIEVDLRSSDDYTKLNAMHKIHLMFGWRYQILTQPVITDRARRPFRVTRGPLPFTPTDIGSSSFILEEDPHEQKDILPLELKKRLAEIGWDQNEGPVDQQKQWIMTPMSLLPSQQWAELGSTHQEISLSPSLLPNNNSAAGDRIDETSLLRRNSSSGGPQQSMKRKAVFVSSLTAVFPSLASLVFDPSYSVSCVAKQILADFMRNDPPLLTRPVLDFFTGANKDMQSAVSTIRAFLHAQKVLPISMSHYTFNHIAGYLKHIARHTEDDALDDFARIIPILSRINAQVSGVSIREIRRAKLEPFFIPSGSLWFPSSAPQGPMFPRNVDRLNPFDDIPSNLVPLTIIRISQNLLFCAMLKRNRQDVEIIRKNMSRVDLPSANSYSDRSLELTDFVPRRSGNRDMNFTSTCLSLMLSRSHLLLVSQVFRSMSRHLNDRTELAILMDGLNRILLAHGDDIGIVSHVMIALMVASTRFRRLFTSGRSYSLFMPAVIKVYTESEFNPGIRMAIEYAVNRFYALHQEAFVFQTIDVAGHLAVLSETEGDWLAKSVYHLFSASRRGITPLTPDAAGIHNVNKTEEREALIYNAAEERPQTFLSFLRRGESPGEPRVKIDIELPEEYEALRFSPDDLVRLFLTVIAHDPSILRAEQFLQFLRFMTPHLYHASMSTRAILQEGIGALAVLLLKPSTKFKGNENLTQSRNEGDSEPLLDSVMHDKSQSPSNLLAMRLDLVQLVSAFTSSGGHVSRQATHHLIDLIKLLLREHPAETNQAVSDFLTAFSHGILHGSQSSIKFTVAFLQDFSPLVMANCRLTDFSGLFEAIADLMMDPVYAMEPSFANVVVTQICSPVIRMFAETTIANSAPSFSGSSRFAAMLGHAVLLHGSDIITVLEEQTPSYDFLVHILLPLVVSIKAGSELQSNDVRIETWNRTALRRAWVRLLSYAMSIWKSSRLPERSKRTQDGKTSSNSKSSQAAVITLSLQIIKIIVIRAEAELSSLPGIWPRLASFLTVGVNEGTANFAFPRDGSPFASPTASPITSPRSSDYFGDLKTSVSGTSYYLPSVIHSSTSPQVIDYILWSTIEFLCMLRTPLFLQMRLLIIEKLAEVDRHLQPHRLRLQNPFDPRNQRLSGSVYIKTPRRSNLPSPASEPYLSPSNSQSLPHDQSLPSFEIERRPGYDVHSPRGDPVNGPKIVHLGPVSAVSTTSAFGRALSGGRGRYGSGKNQGVNGLHTQIESLVLVKETYRRIRSVQTCFGCELMLPLPNDYEINEDQVSKGMWTKGQALEAIMKETKELLEEFEGSSGGVPDHDGSCPS